MISDEKIEFFKSNGYVIIRDLLTPEQTKDLQKWAEEVRNWKPTETSDFMPYEVRYSPIIL
jgi:hypothetical protein